MRPLPSSGAGALALTPPVFSGNLEPSVLIPHPRHPQEQRQSEPGPGGCEGGPQTGLPSRGLRGESGLLAAQPGPVTPWHPDSHCPTTSGTQGQRPWVPGQHPLPAGLTSACTSSPANWGVTGYRLASLGAARNECEHQGDQGPGAHLAVSGGQGGVNRYKPIWSSYSALSFLLRFYFREKGKKGEREG